MEEEGGPIVMKLLVLSDLHGNWAALEAVLAAEPQYDAVAFCGDVVDYGPQPVECLRWLSENADHAIRGNHDNAVGFDMDCQCMGTFREYSVATRAWHRTLLDQTDCNFLRQLPTLKQFEWEGKRFRMAHATPQGDLFEYLSVDQWGDRLVGLDEDFIVLGHTHVQGMQTFGTLTVVNPGSVGLARDHQGKACYAVFQDGQVQLKQILYDVERTITAMREAPLPDQVIEGLVVVLSGIG
jgi:putative phosphoesterase